MGQLVDGVWTKGSISSNDESGSFKRLESVFRHNISDDNDKYIPETNRYHLYVSYACPWAHRTLIFRKLKKLENHISVDYIHPDMLDMGWSFERIFLKQQETLSTIRNTLMKFTKFLIIRYPQKLLFQFCGIKKHIQSLTTSHLKLLG